MKPLKLVRIALRSIARTKMRSLLTMLGIIIGVGAVIAMLALGEGARRATLERFWRMGSNLLILSNQRGRWARNQNLVIREWHAIESLTEYVDMVAPEANITVQSTAGRNSVETRVIGSTPTYFIVRNLEVEHGRPFTG